MSVTVWMLLVVAAACGFATWYVAFYDAGDRMPDAPRRARARAAARIPDVRPVDGATPATDQAAPMTLPDPAPPVASYGAPPQPAPSPAEPRTTIDGEVDVDEHDPRR